MEVLRLIYTDPHQGTNKFPSSSSIRDYLTARIVVNVHLGRDEGAAALHVRYGDVQVGVGKEVVGGGGGGGGGRPVGAAGVG